jgi:hypothetical protein
VALLDKTDRLHLLKEYEANYPPRSDDLAAQNVLSELPRVLVVLICAVVALGTILLLLADFQH